MLYTSIVPCVLTASAVRELPESGWGRVSEDGVPEDHFKEFHGTHAALALLVRHAHGIENYSNYTLVIYF